MADITNAQHSVIPTGTIIGIILGDIRGLWGLRRLTGCLIP